ncbi:unnamed protein product, partial [Polarella glacialis]
LQRAATAQGQQTLSFWVRKGPAADAEPRAAGAAEDDPIEEEDGQADGPADEARERSPRRSPQKPRPELRQEELEEP